MSNEQLREFLKDFILSDEQLQAVYARFCGEIEKGLGKDTHSNADIKCFITYVQQLPTGEEIGKFLALDLGGTNFRVLLVTLQGQHKAQVDSKIYAVPQGIMLGSGTELFDHIAACLENFVETQNVGNEHLPLGFTFSFPCVQKGLTKALLVKWTKGFKCAGVEGEDVGRLLKEAIARRGDLQIDVMAILNDATGTLMSCAHRNTACRIGIIVGTGCNACFVEKAQNVELLEAELKTTADAKMLINTEWGAFGENGCLDFIRTTFDRQVDRLSLNAGSQLFEKMISGMYLGELVRLLLQQCVTKNLIFTTCPNRIQILKILTNDFACFETRFISDIERDHAPDFSNSQKICKDLFKISVASKEDCEKLKFICEVISRRAAALAGIGLSGLINRIVDRKVVVAVDGSVYRYHPKFDCYLREFMRKFVAKGKEFDLMLSEDGSGRGAALVAAVAATEDTRL